MVAKRVPRALLQHWTHSHEEDTEAEYVYRPASFTFPPSRGRSSFEIRANGTMTGETPGPTDCSEAVQGRWSYREEDSALTFYAEDSSKPAKVVQIVSLTKGKLVVKHR